MITESNLSLLFLTISFNSEEIKDELYNCSVTSEKFLVVCLCKLEIVILEANIE